MNREQEALALADELLADIELGRGTTSKYVLKAMRVARLLNDVAAQEWLGFEVNGVPGTDAGKQWMTTTGRWTNTQDGKGWWGSAATIEGYRDSGRAVIAAHSGGVSLSGEYVSIAMRERAQVIKANAGQVSDLNAVLAAVDAQVYRYAADVHAELTYSEMQATLFDQSRQNVDATLALVAGDTLRSVDSIAERLRSGEPDAVSQAMTTCRQLIERVADHLFPPSDEPYSIGDQTLAVRANNVLNRLQAYVHGRGITGGRATRLRRALSDVFDRVSTSVHQSDGVSVHEARYLFLQTYTLLGELLTLDEDSD